MLSSSLKLGPAWAVLRPWSKPHSKIFKIYSLPPYRVICYRIHLDDRSCRINEQTPNPPVMNVWWGLCDVCFSTHTQSFIRLHVPKPAGHARTTRTCNLNCPGSFQLALEATLPNRNQSLGSFYSVLLPKKEISLFWVIMLRLSHNNFSLVTGFCVKCCSCVNLLNDSEMFLSLLWTLLK